MEFEPDKNNKHGMKMGASVSHSVHEQCTAFQLACNFLNIRTTRSERLRQQERDLKNKRPT